MRSGLGPVVGFGALCALLGACGGSDPTPTSSSTPSASAATVEAAPTATKRSKPAIEAPIHASAAVKKAEPTPRAPEAELDFDDPPAPPLAEATLPVEPYSVLIVGGSLAATGVGALLERELDAHPHIEAHRKGKSASGLSRPDFFDWMAEGKRQVDLHHPDLVIVILGGNDGQDVVRLRGDGPRVPWTDEGWADAYREQVDAFLATLTADGAEVLWVGPPAMGLTSLEKKMTIIRDVHENAVEALGAKGIYLDTVPFVSDIEGNLLSEIPGSGPSKAQKLRSEDRIHFTMAGSEYFAAQIGTNVLQALDLSPVEPEDG